MLSCKQLKLDKENITNLGSGWADVITTKKDNPKCRISEENKKNEGHRKIKAKNMESWSSKTMMCFDLRLKGTPVSNILSEVWIWVINFGSFHTCLSLCMLFSHITLIVIRCLTHFFTCLGCYLNSMVFRNLDKKAGAKVPWR